MLLIALSAILVLGVGGNWLATMLRVPGILVLLILGCLAGGVTGWLNPDELFGNSLQPLVSLAVGFILFEGGMTLKLKELKAVWLSIVGLLTVGVLVTWILGSIAAVYLLGMSVSTSLVLAAVLTVTGPTVIGPLLREIRPKGKAGTVAKWEGIVIDPIGATFALLVFEASESIREAQFQSATLNAIMGFTSTAFAGIFVGALLGWLLTEALRRYWMPDHLRNPVVFMFVALAFVIAELLHHESGLVAVTLMGIWLANQKYFDSHSILEFKETITVLLISVLFIVLAARIDLRQLSELAWRGPVFAATLILVVRPVSVFFSTIGSNLAWNERLFLAWFAPRGIVAAAVSAVFGLRMGAAGDLIAPATFVVILTTVAVYGLTAGWWARRLKLAVAEPEGFLIAGANLVGRSIAKALDKAGYDTLLVDNRHDLAAQARNEGLRVSLANVLADYVVEELDLGGLGRFLGLTPNHQTNVLGASRFRSLFGEKNIFCLPQRAAQSRRFPTDPMVRMTGRNLFDSELHYDELYRRLESGWTIRQTKLTAEYSHAKWIADNPQSKIMFTVSSTGRLEVRHQGSKGPPSADAASIIHLSPPRESTS